MSDIVHFPAPDPSRAPPLSYAARVGDLLFVSGIPGYDEAGHLDDTFKAQFERVTAVLGNIFERAGCSFRDLVKVSVLLTRQSDVAQMNSLYAAAFGPPPYPARTTCVVASLPDPRMLIEIECVVAVNRVPRRG